MKITCESFRGNEKEFTVQSAVEWAATPSAYSYDGQLEKLQGENEKLRELVARLVESIYCGEKIAMRDTDRLEYILGYGFSVEQCPTQSD